MKPPVKYRFKSPDGEIFEGENITQFAKARGLDRALMHHVHDGSRNHHKGWTSPLHPLTPYRNKSNE